MDDTEEVDGFYSSEKPTIPVEEPKPNKGKQAIIMFLIGLIFGAVLCFAIVDVSPKWVLNETCINQTQMAYYTGVYDIANYTTQTGNFTIIYNNTLQTYPLKDWCVGWVQTQVNQGGK